VWGRLSPHPAFEAGPHPRQLRVGPEVTKGSSRRVRPTRAAPIALFLRNEASWLLEAAANRALVNGQTPDQRPSLSEPAREVFDALSRRGASFLADLVSDTRQLTSVVEDALWELAAAGLVTADGFENLRALIDPKRRLATARHHGRRARFVPGRWAVLRPASAPGFGGELRRDRSAAAPDSAEEPRRNRSDGELSPATLEAIARQLLLRWGVVFRDLLARETIAPPWRDLLITFRRMEAQGEIRGGRFVSGFIGEQFARPEAVELLRAIRRDRASGDAPSVTAADPLNLAGIVTPGSRISPLSGLVVPLWQDAEPEIYRDAATPAPLPM
jgi:ATP-dependent Lhr-like helicase